MNWQCRRQQVGTRQQFASHHSPQPGSLQLVPSSRRTRTCRRAVLGSLLSSITRSRHRQADDSISSSSILVGGASWLCGFASITAATLPGRWSARTPISARPSSPTKSTIAVSQYEFGTPTTRTKTTTPSSSHCENRRVILLVSSASASKCQQDG